jgi:3-oxoadipate enol-lactonase/3-oxoadipate enol-lactonase/4-carboxymuconolactone decarboxylase
MAALPGLRVRRLGGRPGRPPLVVGPSLGTTVDRLWSGVAAALPDWSVLGWDLPGHGASPPVDRSAPGFTLASLADAVLASVADVVGDVPFAYAGDSIGGAVGLQLALDHPDRVTSLAVLCSAAAFGAPAAWHERAALVRVEGMAPMLSSSPGRWFGSAVRTASETGDDRRIADAVADLAAVDAESYARACEALAGFDVRPRLGGLDVPLLAVAGADDLPTPPSTMAELVAAVRSGRLEVLAGVGHLAPYEAPEEVAALLAEELSPRSPQRTARGCG